MIDELRKIAAERVAALPAGTLPLLGAGLTGALGGAAISRAIGSSAEAERRRRASNRAFGAGMAAGVVTPRALGRLVQIGRDNGLVEEP